MNESSLHKPGDVFEIPLGDLGYGYAKILPFGETSFLDHIATVRITELSKLASSPSIFRLWIVNSAFSRKGNWKNIGYLPIERFEETASKFFKKDKISGKLSIYQNGSEFSNGYDEYPASFEECAGLERAAVWDPEHAESRLKDHFLNRENKWVSSLALDK